MLGGRNLNLSFFLTNQAGNLFDLAFGEILVNALQAGLNSPPGQIWPPGQNLPTSALVFAAVSSELSQTCNGSERVGDVGDARLRFTLVTLSCAQDGDGGGGAAPPREGRPAIGGGRGQAALRGAR